MSTLDQAKPDPSAHFSSYEHLSDAKKTGFMMEIFWKTKTKTKTKTNPNKHLTKFLPGL